MALTSLGAEQHPAILDIGIGPTPSKHRSLLNRYPGITTVVEVIYHRDTQSTHTVVHVDRVARPQGKVVEPSWHEPENVWADKLRAIWVNHILDWLDHDTDVRLLLDRSSLAAKTLTSFEEVFDCGGEDFEFEFEETPVMTSARAIASGAAPAAAQPLLEAESPYIGLSLIYSSPAKLKLSQHSVATISAKSVVVGIHDVEVGHPVACPSWGYISVGKYIGSSKVFVPGALSTNMLLNEQEQ